MNPPGWLLIGIALAYFGLIIVAYYAEKKRQEREKVDTFPSDPE
jgi:hypothetical protein